MKRRAANRPSKPIEARILSTEEGSNPQINDGQDLLSKINDMLSRTMEPIVRRLEDLENQATPSKRIRSNDLNENVAEISTPSMDSSVGLMYVQSPQKPKFAGKDSNPITFLEDLNKYNKKLRQPIEDLTTALECLEGDAKNWSKIYINKWLTFNDFKIDFLGQYWGREAQNKIKNKLANGKWSNQDKRSMFEYFTALFAEARQLTAYQNEDGIVEEIMRHFPLEIRRLWCTKNVEGPIEASKFLSLVECAVDTSDYVQWRTPINKEEENKPKTQFNQRWQSNNRLPQQSGNFNNKNNQNWARPWGGQRAANVAALQYARQNYKTNWVSSPNTTQVCENQERVNESGEEKNSTTLPTGEKESENQ